MGAKVLALSVTFLLLFSAAYANPISDFFGSITGFFVGLVIPPMNTSAYWQCSGYCDDYISSSGLTSCNWIKSELVEGPEDPTGDLCCISGVYIFSAPSENYYYWQSCTPYYTPEICNGLDDDGDGIVDGITQSCGTNTGICTVGTKTCTNGVWSECSGTKPKTETCNGLDDDCDGTTDEGCITYPTYTGYDHYCKNITLSQTSNLAVTGNFQSINDSYLRYFIVSLDCAYSEGKRVYLSSGCTSENCQGGQYCYMGVGSSGTYSYNFENVTAGMHRICLWPTSIAGYLWNITMQYAATPVETTPPTCTVGGSCTVDRTNLCNQWTCSGYCNKPSGANYCSYITQTPVNKTTNPAGTYCCSYYIDNNLITSPEEGGAGSVLDEPQISFIAPGPIITKYWQSCDYTYPICAEFTGSLPGYYGSDCVCSPKKAAGETCSEDYGCYESSCISGTCQEESSTDPYCGDGECLAPESNEYCAEGYCCLIDGSQKTCWAYCPQDCGTGSYCGDGTCNTNEADTCTADCGYLSISIIVPNVTVGNKAYFSLFYSVTPIVAVKDPSGLLVTVTPQPYESSSEGGLFSRVYEFTPQNTGKYTITAYIKINGVKTKEVTGNIYSLAPLPTDTCGDGVCGAGEMNSTCPSDCYTTPNKYCGDNICESYEALCWKDCGFVDAYTMTKSNYVDEKVEFRVNHTAGTLNITIIGPDLKTVSYYSIYAVTGCKTDFCLDKYYFKPAKTGTYTVNVGILKNDRITSDLDYTVVSKKPSDPNWILLTSGDHVDSGHYLCGEITLDYPSIVKIKGIFRNTNDNYARFLLDCVDCGDILNIWALTTTAGWTLYGSETRCETERTSGEFCIMGCCSEGTYIKSHNISAGTHNLCIWPTCPDKYYDIDRIWEADLYYNISHEYIPTDEQTPTEVNVTTNATQPYCGNGIHDPGENHNNCCIDVGCPAHQYCSETNECVKENLPPGNPLEENETESYCGDGVHDPSETKENCCIDVGCPAHQHCSESVNKCVKKAEDIEPTKLLTVALNIEVMRVKLDRLRGDVESIYRYYEGKGETAKEAKWSDILDEFESAIDGLTLMGQKLGEDPTESTLEETRRSMQDFKLNLRNIAIKILEVY